MPLTDGIVGNQLGGVADGDLGIVRMGKTGEFIAGQAHGGFYEPISRGYGFYGATAVAGVAPGTTLSTTAAFALYNPIGSEMIISVISVSIGYKSGTLGSGATYLTTAQGKQITTPAGTAITAKKLKLAGGLALGQAVALTTATVPAQNPIRPICTYGPMLATTPFQSTVLKDAINGEICIAPGSFMGVHSIAGAGTSPLFIIGCTWEEIPMTYDVSQSRTL